MLRLTKPTATGGKFWEINVKRSDARPTGGEWTVIRAWGRLGVTGQKKVDVFPSQGEALAKAISWRDAKIVQRGYTTEGGSLMEGQGRMVSGSLAKLAQDTPVPVVTVPPAAVEVLPKPLDIPTRAQDLVDCDVDLAYQVDRGVKYAWGKYFEATGRIGAVDSLEKVRAGWSLFAREVFGLMLDGYLPPVEGEPVDWAAEAHRVADTLPEYKALADAALGDRWAAGLASVSVAAEIGRVLNKQEQEEKSGTGPGPTGAAGMPDEGAMRTAMRAAAQKATELIEGQRQAEDMIYGGWGNHRGQPVPGDGLKQKVQLAELIKSTPKFNEIMRMAGKMRDMAQSKRRTRRREGCGEIVDVCLGADISRMLPAELGLLNHPIAKLDLLRRMSERQVLCYEMEGKEPMGRGPIVLLIDCSGSMDGGRDVWAKALAIATMNLAALEKRDFLTITYDTQWRRIYVFKPGKGVSLDHVFKLLNEAPSGGTNWEIPLGKARDMMGKGVFQKADLLMITDGDCNVSGAFQKDWASWRKQHDVDAHGYLVNERADKDDEVSGSLTKVMNAVTRVSDLSPSGEALENFFGRVVNH